MKTFLISAVVIALLSCQMSSLSAQTTRGGFVGPVLEMSEIDGSIAIGVGAQAGLVRNRWQLSAFHMQTTKALRPGEQQGELYHLQLNATGAGIEYLQPIGEAIHLGIGLRAAGGAVQREWLLSDNPGAKEKARLWLLMPQTGLGVTLSPRLQISYTTGIRCIGGMEDLSGLQERKLHSWTNALTVKIGWLGK